MSNSLEIVNRFYLNTLYNYYGIKVFFYNEEENNKQNLLSHRLIKFIQDSEENKIDIYGKKDYIKKNQRIVTAEVYAFKKFLWENFGINIGNIEVNAYLSFGGKKRFDIVIKSMKLIIEVDLYSSHYNNNDNEKNIIVNENGWTIIRVRQDKLQDTKFAKIVKFKTNTSEKNCFMNLAKLLFDKAKDVFEMETKKSSQVLKNKLYDFFKEDPEFNIDTFLTMEERVEYYELYNSMKETSPERSRLLNEEVNPELEYN